MIETSGPRVGYVSSKYPRPSQTFVVDEILALEWQGVEVAIFSLNLPDEGRFHRDLAAVQAPVTYLPQSSPSSAPGMLRALSDLGSPAVALEAAVGFVERTRSAGQSNFLVQGIFLARHALEKGLDHLHAHFMTNAARTTYVAHLLTGIPFSVTAHAHDIYRRRVDAAVFREIASAATCVVTVCDANRDYILQKGLARGGRVQRIYNGVFLDQMLPGPQVRDHRLIVAVGRLVEKKGFDVLVDAFGILDQRGLDFAGVIVGDGEEQEALARRLEGLRLQKKVRMAGALPRHEVLGLMARARVLAAPCLAAHDGNQDALPTVMLEALGAGLPIVSTPVGGVPEIVEHGVEGLIVPEGDAQALADSLGRFLVDDALFLRCSAACLPKAARRFDRRETAGELLEIFRRSAGARNAEKVA
jgi:glycosyltransferase involved in cell wall biosynthesis